MSKLADELWRKSNGPHFTKSEFIAALHEYGQEVRRRDAEVCRTPLGPRLTDKDDYWSERYADAITKEPMP